PNPIARLGTITKGDICISGFKIGICAFAAGTAGLVGVAGFVTGAVGFVTGIGGRIIGIVGFTIGLIGWTGTAARIRGAPRATTAQDARTENRAGNKTTEVTMKLLMAVLPRGETPLTGITPPSEFDVLPLPSGSAGQNKCLPVYILH